VPSDPATVLNAVSPEMFSPDNMQLGECKSWAWEDWRYGKPRHRRARSERVPAAGISARLAMVDGCLLIGDSVALWPNGTSWNPRRRSVVFESSPPMQVGDEFSGGGGGYMREDLSGLDGAGRGLGLGLSGSHWRGQRVIATPN
jgi:hypothetical protein